jgi:RNA 3'-terminal phosphate cyclase (ATP)
MMHEIRIDGSEGEGGGQILRTALSLSMMTGTPFVIENIRAGRSKPGLLRQHLACVNAAAEITSAVVEGAELQSKALRFQPGPIRTGDYRFSIGSAGSSTLVLQTVLLPLASAGRSTVTVEGGTHNSMCPNFEFLQECYRPVLA